VIRKESVIMAEGLLSNVELAQKIEEHISLKSQIDVLEYKLKEVQKALKEDMDRREESKYEFKVDDRAYKISYSKYMKKSFQSKLFQEEHPKLYNKYLTESMSSRFSCS
jgi:predicted phage-related endonuclease